MSYVVGVLHADDDIIVNETSVDNLFHTWQVKLCTHTITKFYYFDFQFSTIFFPCINVFMTKYIYLKVQFTD